MNCLSKLPIITGRVKQFSIPDGSFKSFENYTVKLSAKETKWTSLEVRTRPTFIEILSSKYGLQARSVTGSFEKRASGR